MEDIAFKILRTAWIDIQYSTIEDFFKTPQVENDQLEFKSYSSDKDQNVHYRDLAKEVCAFLNSEGGILIWGAPQTDRSTKTCHGNLTSTPDLETDDVVRKITGKIIEIPTGIKVHKLQHNGGNIFIFQIPKSENRPHQTDDRYFMRLHAESLPAPHHYIEALMKRVRYPDLRGSLQFTSVKYSKVGSQYNDKFIRVDVMVRIENHSPFQNEESPRFILYCDHGTPIRGWEQWPLPQKDIIEGIRRIPSIEIVHYGEKFERHYAIGFDLENLSAEGYRINAVLKFGGRYSPLKLSRYEVDLSFFSQLTYNEDHNYEFPAGNIVSNENILIANSDLDMDDLDLWGSIEND